MVPVSDRFVFDCAPQRVYWETTTACDLACRHCRAEAATERDPDELSTEEGFRLLERLKAFGEPAPHVILTGGDPLKRPDLFVLIERARALGLGVSVAPSGTPLLTADAIARFKDAGVEAISLSVDGSTADRHDAVRRVPGCFDRTCLAAETARAVGLPFQVNTLVAQETLSDIPAIYPLVSAWGAARWCLFFLISVGRGTMLREISPSACEQLLSWLANLTGRPGPIVTTTEAPHFRRVMLQRRHGAASHGGHPAPVSHPVGGIRDGNGILFVARNGDITPSGFLPVFVGNVRTHDVVAVYRHSEEFLSLRRADKFGGRCGHCEFRGPCGGSRARAYAAYGDQMAEDPLCVYHTE
jgi:radical SAM protein